MLFVSLEKVLIAKCSKTFYNVAENLHFLIKEKKVEDIVKGKKCLNSSDTS